MVFKRFNNETWFKSGMKLNLLNILQQSCQKTLNLFMSWLIKDFTLQMPNIGIKYFIIEVPHQRWCYSEFQHALYYKHPVQHPSCLIRVNIINAKHSISCFTFLSVSILLRASSIVRWSTQSCCSYGCNDVHAIADI